MFAFRPIGLAVSFAGIASLVSAMPAASEVVYGVDYSGDAQIGNRIWKIDTDTAETTLLTTKVFNSNGWQSNKTFVQNNKMYVWTAADTFNIYDIENDSWSGTTAITGAFQGVFANIGGGGSTGAAVDLTPVHERINKNKKAIDTNRTNINNLGDGIAASTALGAALSALPVTPDDAPFSCGVGSGAYSSRFAMGLGCVAKLNQRLSINAGGSHVFGGSSNYGGGSLDSVAWRGGFVLKLGKIDSPAATNEQLQSKVESLEKTNASILQDNAAIKEENAAIKQANKALIARLERLEAIALGQQPATNTASLK